MDEGKEVDGVFLDFNEAFDTASHSTLLHKLSNSEWDEQIHDVLGEELAEGEAELRGLQ